MPSRGRFVTIVQASLLVVALALTAYLANLVFQPRPQPPRSVAPAGVAGPQRRGMARRGFPQPERRILKDFDKDGNKRLDAAERTAARQWLLTQAGDRRGGFGRGGGAMETPSPGMRLAPAGVRSYPGAPLYDLRTLRTIFLTFENPDWEPELRAFYRTDVDVPASVMVDGKTYRDVGVHFRGNSSFRGVPEGLKHSLNLTFDLADQDQHLGGYRTLNLLNSHNDATFVRTVLYSEVARHYLPIPLANFARVVINGESWGVFVNVQQFNKDFLRDWYHDTSGARWKVPGSPGGRGGLEYLGNDLTAYKRIYEIKTKDDRPSWDAFVELCKVLNETPADRLESALAPILDIDGALKFLALDVALVNGDGYWTRASDYNIYRDPAGKFHILPHDFNEGFGGEGAVGRGFGGGPASGTDLDPLVGLDDAAKPLRSKLLAVPALRARYLAYVRDIATRWLDWRTLRPMVRQWQALIEPDVTVDTRKMYSTDAFYADVGDSSEYAAAPSAETLRGFVERRRAFLLR